MWFRNLLEAWRANPRAAGGVAVTACSIVLASIVLTFRPARERVADPQKPSAVRHEAPQVAISTKRTPTTPPVRPKVVDRPAAPSVHTKAAVRAAEPALLPDAVERPAEPALRPEPALPLTPVNPALVSFQPTSDLLVRGHQSPSKVARTFDAGSDAKAVPLILKTLAERHVHATFFLTGRFCEKFPEECKAIADAGMELGNHSYRHPHFTRLSEAKIREELERAEAAILKACGRGAKPLFRFPYGDSNARTQRIVAAAGYQPIHWTLDSLDAFGRPKTADFVVSRIDSRVKPGFITLMHVSCVTSAEALPRIFDQLDKMGAHVVPVSELLLSAAPGAKTDLAGMKERIAQ